MNLLFDSVQRQVSEDKSKDTYYECCTIRTDLGCSFDSRCRPAGLRQRSANCFAPPDILNAIAFILNLSQAFVQSKNFGKGFGNSRYEIVALTV